MTRSDRDRETVARQVAAALGAAVGDTHVLCLRCGRAEYIVMSVIRGGGIGCWSCSVCGQDHEVRLLQENWLRRVQTKRPEEEWPT